jgi:hypothetical protein
MKVQRNRLATVGAHEIYLTSEGRKVSIEVIPGKLNVDAFTVSPQHRNSNAGVGREGRREGGGGGGQMNKVKERENNIHVEEV